MNRLLDKMNSKVFLVISIAGLIASVGLFIYSLFNDISLGVYSGIAVCVFIVLFGINKQINSSNIKDLVLLTGIILAVIFSITVFVKATYTDAKDWTLTKGVVVSKKKGRHSGGDIDFTFRVDNRQIEDSKDWDIFSYFGKGFREKDSISVVYSKANPLINDIYALDEKPDLHARENYLLYFFKHSTVLKWVLFFSLLVLVLKWATSRRHIFKS